VGASVKFMEKIKVDSAWGEVLWDCLLVVWVESGLASHSGSERRRRGWFESLSAWEGG
jgi:hypothetical protein